MLIFFLSEVEKTVKFQSAGVMAEKTSLQSESALLARNVHKYKELGYMFFFAFFTDSTNMYSIVQTAKMLE